MKVARVYAKIGDQSIQQVSDDFKAIIDEVIGVDAVE